MQQTYENLRELSKLYEGAEDLTEVAYEYQVVNGEDAAMLSFAFCKLYAFSCSQVEKYFDLTDSDKASIVLEELHKALMDFDPDKGAQPITLFRRYLGNRLKTEVYLSNHAVRRANINALTPDDTLFSTIAEPATYENEVEIKDALQTYNLTEKELLYCQIVMEDTVHIKNVDIAARLGITSAGVNWIQNSLKRKLVDFSFC